MYTASPWTGQMHLIDTILVYRLIYLYRLIYMYVCIYIYIYIPISIYLVCTDEQHQVNLGHFSLCQLLEVCMCGHTLTFLHCGASRDRPWRRATTDWDEHPHLDTQRTCCHKQQGHVTKTVCMCTLVTHIHHATY